MTFQRWAAMACGSCTGAHGEARVAAAALLKHLASCRGHVVRVAHLGRWGLSRGCSFSTTPGEPLKTAFAKASATCGSNGRQQGPWAMRSSGWRLNQAAQSRGGLGWAGRAARSAPALLTKKPGSCPAAEATTSDCPFSQAECQHPQQEGH